MEKKIKVLMVASEAAPIVKVGGLGDVIGSLPAALAKLGCEVRIIIPLSLGVDKEKYRLKKICSGLKINFSGKSFAVDLWETRSAVPGAIVYLVENDHYFGREAVYPASSLASDASLAEKFLFFELAALESLPVLKFIPDIIHCHDFFSGLIPVLLKMEKFQRLKNIKTLYTIHNFEHQGKVVPKLLELGDLHPDKLASLARDAADGDINFMVQGIINADLVNTVSPAYAREILTGEYSAGLGKITKAYRRKIFGVLNGIDTDFFNPSTDKLIKQRYSAKDLEKKTVNKLFLQKKLGLPADGKIPVVAMISRLSDQKGWELITEKLIEQDCQFVFLGEGDQRYADLLADLEKNHPEKVRSIIGFEPVLANQIYAAADIFLVPSRFEPCGLTQMISARYGTVIVARATGGLKDTVTPDIGFTFKDFSAPALFLTLKKALDCYWYQPKKWLKLKNNCLKKDFSWSKTARGYLHLYKKLVG
ncbi:MAG: glycogen/starch synthase [Patescibacteria group bacterium]|nr:glycogen/starch synthase [Patescibacteria group bacterium]